MAAKKPSRGQKGFAALQRFTLASLTGSPERRIHGLQIIEEPLARHLRLS